VRAFPGRGIRIWGARTLTTDAAWAQVSVRRLILTIGRWLERSSQSFAFEPNNFALWVRINRQVTAYLQGLFERGALKGTTATEAFFVKCDAETNPPDVRGAGKVVTEVSVAPVRPNEFITVRLVSGADGVAGTY
jgi:phage tail sheath protein FI